MWTPRRIVLFLLALFASGAAYFIYLSFYGGLDGLPILPTIYLESGEDKPPPPPPDGLSPTVLRLIEAFGTNSPEVQDRIAYTLRLEDRERGLVISSGQPVFKQEPSRFVTVSPFSVAFFAKAKSANQLAPGEVPEISTFHAERAVLEFDREVANAQDLNGKDGGKLVGMELVSLPDLPSVDERRGFIEITNNQRSRDRNQQLVFRTTGPLFYSAPREKPTKKPAELEAPHVWTSASVVVVDRKNLARPLRGRSSETGIVSGDDLRSPDAIANILLGNTLPPPTITGIGMKIYLQPESNTANSDKRNATGFSGVRLIELGEKVQFNLWTDDGAGFPGSNTPAAEAPPTDRVEPPEQLMALLGGLSDALAVAQNFETRKLMVIETLGSFRHDFKNNQSIFAAAQGVSPGVPNHVVVARFSTRNRQDNMVCQLLKVDFADKKDAPASASTGSPSTSSGMKIKGINATGPNVYIEIDSENLKANGTELEYQNEPLARSTTTILRGSPVVTQKDKNLLMGGDTGVPGEIVLKSIDPAPKSKDPKQTMISVNSRGKLEMYDDTSNAKTMEASWGKSLTQAKDLVGTETQDVLTFDGGASFRDVQGGMQLSGDTLKLWLSGMGKPSGNTATTSSNKDNKSPNQALPQRLLAINNVTASSSDLDITNTELLTVWFRDTTAPKVEPLEVDPKAKKPTEVVAAPMPPKTDGKRDPVAPPMAPPNPPPVVAKAEPEPAKPPVKLEARVIETWVARYPLPAVNAPTDAASPKATTAGKKPAPKTTLKYEMERARCDDRVIVHQDPVDPKKNPRGLDIAGLKLNLEQSRAGSILTVYGTLEKVAQVHYESLSLFGGTITIDQVNNAARVPGAGKLIMPTTQQQASNGTTAKGEEKVAEMEITWSKSMNFQGAKAFAEFIGNVQVLQQPIKAAAPAPMGLQPVAAQVPPNAEPESISRTRVYCYRLDTTFDKPIYFNQNRNKPKSGDGKTEEESAKIKTAVCTPIPDAEVALLPREKQDKIYRDVTYLDETLNPTDGKYVKAQMIEAKLLELNNDPRGRIVMATGPGIVRMLQLGSKDGVANSPTPDQPKKAPNQAEKSGKESDQEMKLTLVKFPSRMIARDTANRYQEARFDDGAQVWHIPTDNLFLRLVEHAPPKRTVYLSCADRLVVSSTPADKPNLPPQQEMEAIGNGEFENDEYRGTSAKILFDGNKVIFEGSRDRLAKFYRKRVGLNNTHNTSAERIEYFKDGNIRYLGTSTGTLGSNP